MCDCIYILQLKKKKLSSAICEVILWKTNVQKVLHAVFNPRTGHLEGNGKDNFIMRFFSYNIPVLSIILNAIK